ncbi:hypothetical protein GCM10023093_31220 [Nemorincola caseinilytica]|uniref:Glycosyltransferase RgtA/B/C/D-like domain-containing protein n=1 Tax=Nemorincola caseinilytica TaxID=2054315 RepID=A0ABP8NNT6_9BACT
MWSRIVIALFFATSVFVINNRQNWDNDLYSYDPFGYYLYLPATIIYKDVGELKFYPQIYERYHFRGWESKEPYGTHLMPNGRRVNKYPAGVAIAQLPLFLVAHTFCLATHMYPADGFSPPYRLAGVYTYPLLAVLGLLLLRRLLRRYHTDGVVAFTLLCLSFGTNLYHYIAFEQGMSHPVSFVLFAAILYHTDSWYRTGERKHLLLTGLLLGWVIITRPVNIVVAILPLLWGVASMSDLRDRWALFVRNSKNILAAAGLCLAVCMIQMAYWKYTTGHWITYSYKGEHFDLAHPRIWDGLFSFRKGWFVYTPMALLGVAGFVALWRTHKKLVPAMLVFFSVFTYVVFSWKMWWYGGSFGCRPFIEALTVLALPLAALVSYVHSRRKKLLTSAAVVVVAFFITLNMFQSYQYSMYIIHWDRMTFEAYRRSFGKVWLNREEYETYLIDGKTYWDERAEISKE